MRYHLFSAAFLVAAVVLEVGGFAGFTALLIAGIACEIWFWTGVVRHRRQ